jgi:hypothetical protein
MLNKTKVVSSFYGNLSKTDVAEKSRLTEGEGPEKRGTPENEGKSVDVYENKGSKSGLFQSEDMLLKTNGLRDF